MRKSQLWDIKSKVWEIHSQYWKMQYCFLETVAVVRNKDIKSQFWKKIVTTVTEVKTVTYNYNYEKLRYKVSIISNKVVFVRYKDKIIKKNICNCVIRQNSEKKCYSYKTVINVAIVIYNHIMRNKMILCPCVLILQYVIINHQSSIPIFKDASTEDVRKPVS